MKKPLSNAHRIALGFGAALAIGGPATTRTLVAQTVEDAKDALKICFRGRPMPDCRSFWIVEMQGHTRVAQSSRKVGFGGGTSSYVGAFDDELEWNLGHMVNVTPSLAIGGVFTAGTGAGSGPFTGLKARARRWLNRDVSLELEGGWLRTGARYPAANGITMDARLNIRDQGSFFVRWDGVRLAPQNVDSGSVYGYGFVDAGGFQQAVSVGLGVGSVPALVGTGALGLGYVILIAAYLSGGYD